MEIKDLKIKYEAATSEELFGIEPQKEEQCPKIDEVIKEVAAEAKNVKDVYDDLRGVPEAEDYISGLDWAAYNLRNLDGNMEGIRTNIVELRGWGQGWKDLAIKLIEERESIDDLI